MRLELPPQKGIRDAEICPKLESTDSPESKWAIPLLTIEGDMPELRLHPMKSPYQLQPIIRINIKERQLRKTQKEEPAKDTSRKEQPKQDRPTP